MKNAYNLDFVGFFKHQIVNDVHKYVVASDIFGASLVSATDKGMLRMLSMASLMLAT